MSKTHRSAAVTAAGIALLIAGATASTPGLAGPPVKKKAPAAAVTYECAKCHMKVSAATAKKDHYKDPMDGGAFAPVKPASKPASPAAKKMGAMGKGDKMGGMKGM